MPSSPELRGPERSRAALIAGLIVTYVLALGIPIGFKIYFRSGISNLLLLLPLLVTTTTGVVRRLLDRRARWIALPALLPPVGFAVLLLVGILITPYSSYAIWIESVQMGRPTGSVSNIFVLTYAFFSSILSPLVLTMGFVWPIAILAAATLCVTTIVMQSSTLFVITLIAFAVATIVLMARWSHRGHRFAAVLFYLVILIASAALGRLLTGKGVARGSALIDDSVYPRLREIVTEVYPGIPLLYEIPGYGFSFGAKQRIGNEGKEYYQSTGKHYSGVRDCHNRGFSRPQPSKYVFGEEEQWNGKGRCCQKHHDDRMDSNTIGALFIPGTNPAGYSRLTTHT